MHREERYQVHSHKYGIFHAFRNTTTTKARGSVWSIGHRRPLAICTLFWANLAAPVQFVLCCLSSASVSHLQLLRGRPLFLFPCEFQVRAWRVMVDAGFLRVCPIQSHFLFRICFATGSCPARSHSSSFGIISGHRML